MLFACRNAVRSSGLLTCKIRTGLSCPYNRREHLGGELKPEAKSTEEIRKYSARDAATPLQM